MKIWVKGDLYDDEAILCFRTLRKPCKDGFDKSRGPYLYVLRFKAEYVDRKTITKETVFLTGEEGKAVLNQLKERFPVYVEVNVNV